MATVTNKRRVLNSKEKLSDMTNEKNEKQKADVCRKFGLVNSTVQTIWKDSTKLLVRVNRMDQEYSNSESMKKSGINEAPLKRFMQKRSEKAPVISLLLMIPSVLPKF